MSKLQSFFLKNPNYEKKIIVLNKFINQLAKLIRENIKKFYLLK